MKLRCLVNRCPDNRVKVAGRTNPFYYCNHCGAEYVLMYNHRKKKAMWTHVPTFRRKKNG